MIRSPRGRSGRYRATGLSRPIFPSAASWRSTVVAIDSIGWPTRKTASLSVGAVPGCRSIAPRASSRSPSQTPKTTPASRRRPATARTACTTRSALGSDGSSTTSVRSPSTCWSRLVALSLDPQAARVEPVADKHQCKEKCPSHGRPRSRLSNAQGSGSPKCGSKGWWFEGQTVPRDGTTRSMRYLLVARFTQLLGSDSLV